jgi:hypothetical protein
MQKEFCASFSLLHSKFWGMICALFHGPHITRTLMVLSGINIVAHDIYIIIARLSSMKMMDILKD